MRARLASASVILQGITMLLALPVLSTLSADAQSHKTFVLVVALLLLLSPAIFRRRGGFVIGSTLQVLALAVSLANSVLLVLTVLFNILWIVSLRLGGRIERERIERQQGLDSSQ